MQTLTGLVVSASWQNWLDSSYCRRCSPADWHLWNSSHILFIYLFLSWHCGNSDLSALPSGSWPAHEHSDTDGNGYFHPDVKVPPNSHVCLCWVCCRLLVKRATCRAIRATIAAAPMAQSATADWKITSKAVKCHFYTLISCRSCHFTHPAVFPLCSHAVPSSFISTFYI